MAIVKVKTTAVINGNPVGSTIELPKESAVKLANKNYVTIIAESKPKKAPAKKASAPKKPAKETSAKKDAKKETESK